MSLSSLWKTPTMRRQRILNLAGKTALTSSGERFLLELFSSEINGATRSDVYATQWADAAFSEATAIFSVKLWGFVKQFLWCYAKCWLFRTGLQSINRIKMICISSFQRRLRENKIEFIAAFAVAFGACTLYFIDWTHIIHKTFYESSDSFSELFCKILYVLVLNTVIYYCNSVPLTLLKRLSL